jgi:phospholipid/cholesterol/gamma-HCH transport system substrate-binding protein
MTTRAQKVRLGVFMVLALLLFLGAVATLAGMKLWNPRDRYHVRFSESISGLEVGSTVKMKGVRVGQVEKIEINKENVESVVVTLTLNPKTPVPEDTRAVMTSIGITGLQFIELTGGTNRAKRITPNTPESFITPAKGTLESLTGKASDIAVKMEEVLNNLRWLTAEDNRTRVRKILDDADKLLVTWEGLGSENRPRLKRILSNVDRTTALLEKASHNVSKLVEDNSGQLKEAITAASAAAKSLQHVAQGINPQATLNAITGAATSMRKRIEDPAITHALASVNAAVSRLGTFAVDLGKVVRTRDRQLGMVMENLDRASSYLKEFARSIKERPSLLLRGETIKERKVP